jgi:hypothetical protein
MVTGLPTSATLPSWSSGPLAELEPDALALAAWTIECRTPGCRSVFYEPVHDGT